jgi:uncharacterized protein
LSKTIGDEKTLLIYQLLLKKTKKVVESAYADKFVFYADAITEDDLWNDYYKLVQSNGDLGFKMKTAFDFVFNLGYDKVCIIGSDCYDITTNTINECFSQLKNTDIVFGPANDGGYYLLGQKKNNDSLFFNIAWSTHTVLENSKQLCNDNELSYYLLPTLIDIDTIEDIEGCKDLHEQYLQL